MSAWGYTDNAAITGTVTGYTQNVNIVGSSTLFLSNVNAGDYITIAGQKYQVNNVTTNTALTTANTALTTANTKISSLETITAKFSGYEFKPVCMKRTNSAYYRTWWDYDKECDVSGNINSGWNEGGFTAILPVKSKY